MTAPGMHPCRRAGCLADGAFGYGPPGPPDRGRGQAAPEVHWWCRAHLGLGEADWLVRFPPAPGVSAEPIGGQGVLL